jgi:glycosyltransferase involved in cell wall biosynthesis
VRLAHAGETEAAGFDVHAYADDAELSRILAQVRPQVIVSVGGAGAFAHLDAAPAEIRRRRVVVSDPAMDPAEIADAVMEAFLRSATGEQPAAEPLVSVFTPAYLTGDKIERPWCSLLAQTYANWEWVIYDDSPDEGKTFAQLSALAGDDFRVSVHRADRPSGRIGEVKQRACGLARGEILAELDHDDALTPNALADVVEAYAAFPDAGFFYTDCAEIFESGHNAYYPDGWGLGYGSYRHEELDGHEYLVTNYPGVNAKTIRHIVGVPNHLRAWTREGYFTSGGHNPEIHVGDDYELIVRTFLTTRMVHVQRFGYVQYHNNVTQRVPGGNTQRLRNAEIQRLVRYFRDRYSGQIHERFLDLGVDDFIWRPGGELDWDVPSLPDAPIANYQLP